MSVTDNQFAASSLDNLKQISVSSWILYFILSIFAINFLISVIKHKGLWFKKSLKGKHVFITGGAMGLGRNMAKRLLKLNCQVTIGDVNETQLKQLEQELSKEGFKDYACTFCDVTIVESISQAAAIAREKFGMIDVLINNAGIVSGKGLLENTIKMIDKTIAVNTTSHHYTVREFLPDMLKSNKGHIVNIASIAGHSGVNKLIDYCASKHGAIGFNSSLRMELKKLKSDVKTTCISPYYINTGMFDGVKTKWPLILDILDENFASKRIVWAIQQNEDEVFMPYVLHLLLLAKAVLPASWSDYLSCLFGTNEGMDEFKGRGGK